MTVPIVPDSGQPPATPPSGDTPAVPSAGTLLTGETPPAVVGDPPQPPAAGGDPPPPSVTPPTVPDKYELALPENAAIDTTALERTATTARELGLSNEAGQKMVNFLNTEVAAREEAFLTSNKPGGVEWTKRVSDWEGAALSDTDVGGSPEKLQESVAISQRVLAEFFPTEIKEFLQESGFGSHPALLRGLAKIGRAMLEDDVTAGPANSGKRRPEDVLFDKTTEK